MWKRNRMFQSQKLQLSNDFNYSSFPPSIFFIRSQFKYLIANKYQIQLNEKYSRCQFIIIIKVIITVIMLFLSAEKIIYLYLPLPTSKGSPPLSWEAIIQLWHQITRTNSSNRGGNIISQFNILTDETTTKLTHTQTYTTL